MYVCLVTGQTRPGNESGEPINGANITCNIDNIHMHVISHGIMVGGIVKYVMTDTMQKRAFGAMGCM